MVGGDLWVGLKNDDKLDCSGASGCEAAGGFVWSDGTAFVAEAWMAPYTIQCGEKYRGKIP